MYKAAKGELRAKLNDLEGHSCCTMTLRRRHRYMTGYRGSSFSWTTRLMFHPSSKLSKWWRKGSKMLALGSSHPQQCSQSLWHTSWCWTVCRHIRQSLTDNKCLHNGVRLQSAAIWLMARVINYSVCFIIQPTSGCNTRHATSPSPPWCIWPSQQAIYWNHNPVWCSLVQFNHQRLTKRVTCLNTTGNWRNWAE